MSVMMPFSRSRAYARRQRLAAGFTLVETVIAVGIVATVMLAMMSLLPLGISTLKDASVRQADARIVQTLVGVYQMQDWASVEQQETTEAAKDFYFDEKGVLVEKTDQTQLYTARVTIKGPPVVPGDTRENPFMRRMEIFISDRPLNLGDPFEEDYPTNEHTALIAKVDK